MAATKFSTGTNGATDYCVIDAAASANGVAVFAAGVAGAPGYDEQETVGGDTLTAFPQSQGKNAIAGGNGNVLIDTNNDALPNAAVNKSATVQGNSAYGAGVAQSPTQNVPAVAQSAQTVLNTQMVRLIWKNPA